jgi:ribosome modulation factor
VGLSDEAVRRLQRDYPGMAVMARSATVFGPKRTFFSAIFRRSSSGAVVAVRVRVKGIRGGRSRARCAYELIIDTSDLRRAIPAIWVASPKDRDIKHVNIWPKSKSFCPYTGVNLPSFCWNTFSDGWDQAPQQARTLGNVLEYAKQLLNTENHDSPAR